MAFQRNPGQKTPPEELKKWPLSKLNAVEASMHRTDVGSRDLYSALESDVQADVLNGMPLGEAVHKQIRKAFDGSAERSKDHKAELKRRINAFVSKMHDAVIEFMQGED